jgi:hypothetical protein
MLVYLGGSTLFRQPFNSETAQLFGDPAVIDQLETTDPTTSLAPVSISGNGVIVYGGGRPFFPELAWFDSLGGLRNRLIPGGPVRFFRLSPDGSTIAVERLEFRTGVGSLWLIDTARGVTSRFFVNAPTAFAPVWSPDGRELLFASVRSGVFELRVRPLAADGAERLLLASSEPVVPTDWSAHDGLIVYEQLTPSGGWDIRAMRPPQQMRGLIETPFHERLARIASSGKWLAYTSNESGVEQVYARPLSGGGPKIQISITGGTQPSWSADGSTLYFVAPGSVLMRSFFAPGTRINPPTALFRLPTGAQSGLMAGWQYAFAKDGASVLAPAIHPSEKSIPLTVVVPAIRR